MTREEAIKHWINYTGDTKFVAEQRINVFEALGFAKFDEPLAASTIILRSLNHRDIDLSEVLNIIKALNNAGYQIVKINQHTKIKLNQYRPKIRLNQYRQQHLSDNVDVLIEGELISITQKE